MISVVSSYKIAPPNSEALSTLNEVCCELRDHNIFGIDVYLSACDIQNIADQNLTDENDENSWEIEVVAKEIASIIHGCVEKIDMLALQVPALATNFPNISNIDNYKRDIDTRYLATCFLIAHFLDVNVVEIVCGRRISTSLPNGNINEQTIEITKPDDAGIIQTIQEIFYKSIFDAYDLCKNVINKYPNVAVALEIEPDILALARDIVDTFDLVIGFREFVDTTDIPDNDKNDLKARIGINLDWGHIFISLDRVKPRKDYNDISEVIELLEHHAKEGRHVLHTHVSDHARGAHWADGPLGHFRPMEEYKELIEFFNRQCNKERIPFSTNVLSIEIESSNTFQSILISIERLQAYAKKINIPLHSNTNTLDIVENAIGRLNPDEITTGWLEGVNRTIYLALSKYVEHHVYDEKHLLNTKILKYFKAFLSEKREDKRTILALKIIKDAFQKIGFERLGDWSDFLLKGEYGREFYTGYRDHSVHVLYVYLLGWYFYISSPQIRSLLQGDDDLEYPSSPVDSPFARKWTLAALGHDLGYVFESERYSEEEGTDPTKRTIDKTLQIKAVDKLNTYIENFICAVDNTKPNQQKQLLNQLNQAILVRPFKDVSEIAKQIGYLDHLNTLGGELGIGGHAFTDLFDLFSNNAPNGKYSSGRPPFCDHGIMSGALIYKLHTLESQWISEIQGNQINAITPLTQQRVTKIEDWAAERKDSIWRSNGDEDIYEVLLAIAAHNIYPEKEEGEEGVLYGVELLEKFNIALNDFSIKKNTPLAMFLSICDTLQDWDRSSFASPREDTRIKMLPVEIKFNIEANGKIRYQAITDGDFTAKKNDEFQYRFEDDWKDFFVIGS